MRHRGDARALLTQAKVYPTLRKTLNQRSCQGQWPRRTSIVAVAVGSHEAKPMESVRTDSNMRLSPIDFVPIFETCSSASPWMIRCSSELKTSIGQTTEMPNASRDHAMFTKSALSNLRRRGLTWQLRLILRHGLVLQPSFPWTDSCLRCCERRAALQGDIGQSTKHSHYFHFRSTNQCWEPTPRRYASAWRSSQDDFVRHADMTERKQNPPGVSFIPCQLVLISTLEYGIGVEV
jgi:hypothetical protein